MKKYVLALDEGTTSARAILFDKEANIVSIAQHEIKQIYPCPGWVEQDPMDIYANQYAALTECIAKSGIAADEIAAVGITNQRETVILWDKNTGRPLYNAIVWQCRRTTDICEQLEAAGHGEYIRKTTGLRLDPYFSGTKIKWILDNVEGIRDKINAGEVLAGTVDTWLIWKLTDGKVFVTDRTNASRTMLCDIHTGKWDQTILDMLGIPKEILPEIKSSSEIYGTFECMGAQLTLSGIAGDQQSALFGQSCFCAGEAKNTYGTGCFLLAHTGERAVESQHGLLTTIAAGEKGRPIEYALEGSVFVGGAVIRWLRDELKLIHEASDSEYFARKVKDSAGVYLVPAFSGLGAPIWDMHARGTILGLTAGTGKNHIIRAALESIAFQTEDVIDAMNADIELINNGEGSGKISVLKVDGGASANDLLMQMQSDISDIVVRSSANPEATAAGAAFLAGLAVGFFTDRNELKKLSATRKSFEPCIDESERKQRLGGWHRAVAACRRFSESEE
jgi:glycerol kinase